MKKKSYIQFGMTEEGFFWHIPLKIDENGKITTKEEICKQDRKGMYQRYKVKAKLRDKDYKWVQQNIPSSIWWHTEIHHDWSNNGTMFLLTKGEHILIERRIRNEKQRKG